MQSRSVREWDTTPCRLRHVSMAGAFRALGTLWATHNTGCTFVIGIASISETLATHQHHQKKWSRP
jgi:hypothetical protein